MRVLFLPWNRKNPYQQNLADGLGALGTRVVGCRPGKFLPVLGSVWRHGRPDALHMHWISGYLVSRYPVWTVLSSLLFLLELIVLRALRVRIVWTVHNLVEHKQRAAAFELRVTRWVAKLCDTLVVHCERGRSAVAAAHRLAPDDPRFAVIPHGNYLRNYPDEIEAASARAQLGIASTSFVYVFLGMVRPYKGIEDLLDAFGSLADPAARLLVVGDCRNAELAARIHGRAAADPRILPVLRHVPDEQIQVYMRAADAVVLPFSDVFTSGSAILAMGFGRALVVPRLGCLPDYVDARGGIVYEPGSSGLTHALREISRADTEAMGRHNRAVAERLDWRGIAASTLRAYRSSARGRPKDSPAAGNPRLFVRRLDAETSAATAPTTPAHSAGAAPPRSNGWPR